MKQELVPEGLLDAIKNDYGKTMYQASQRILQEGVTKYPMFIATRDLSQLGVPLILGKEYRREWNIFMSSPEEFYNKQVMSRAEIEQFLKDFKDPQKYLCVLFIEGKDIRLLYIPIERTWKY